MHNCKLCPETKDTHRTIGKTYYIMPDLTLMCYRHWYQANKPKFLYKNEHGPVGVKLNEMLKLKARGEDPTKALPMDETPTASDLFPGYKYRSKKIVQYDI